MPIIPSVFQPVRANDVQQRPIKAYKNYQVTHETRFTASGHMKHDAHYLKHTPHITMFDVASGVDAQYGYPYNMNGVDVVGANKHVVWNTIDHRYYRHPYNPAKTAELSDKRVVEKFLFHSASILTIPYFDVGERIKPGSVTGSVSFPTVNSSYEFEDDGFGNLRNRTVATESFASESRCVFHMSFNERFRDCTSAKSIFSEHGGEVFISSSEHYKIGKVEKTANSIYAEITGGVQVQGQPWKSNAYGIGFLSEDYVTTHPASGLALQVNRSAGNFTYVRVPHDDKFDRFGECDEWSIAFWIQQNQQKSSNLSTGVYDTDGENATSTEPIITKGGVTKEFFYDPVEQKMFERDKEVAFPDLQSDFSKFRTPFMIAVETELDEINSVVNEGLHNDHHQEMQKSNYIFKSSNGTRDFVISASNEHNYSGGWDHVVIQHSASICRFFINGKTTGTSGSLPAGPTTNKADIMIGNPNTKYIISDNFLVSGSTDSLGGNNPTIWSSTMTFPPGNYVIEGDVTVTANINIGAGAEVIIHGNLIVVSAEVNILGDGYLKCHGQCFNSIAVNVIDNGTFVIGKNWAPNHYALSEVRMYDYALNQTAIDSLSNRHYLSGSLYQTNVIGNSFYRNGQFVISSPMPIYHTGSGAFGGAFSLDYRGTHTIYENEVLLRVDKDHFNVAMNPTANFKNATVGDPCDTDKATGLLPGEFIKGMFVSGTALPYITTIGLYNDEAQMLAVAKLAQPIQKRDDVDMNFVVRWDY